MAVLPSLFHWRGAARVGRLDFSNSRSIWHQCDPDAGEENQPGSQDHLFQKKEMWTDTTNAVSNTASSRVLLKVIRVPGEKVSRKKERHCFQGCVLCSSRLSGVTWFRGKHLSGSSAIQEKQSRFFPFPFPSSSSSLQGRFLVGCLILDSINSQRR